jgi:hypothetical protein
MTEIASGTTFGGTLTEADALAAMRLHLRPGRKLRIAIIVYLIVAVLVLAAELSLSSNYTLAFVLVGLLAFIGLVLFVVFPIRARLTFRQYKALQESFTVEVRDTGLFFKRANGEALMPWSHVHRWKYNEQLALIYPAITTYHLLPASFFPTRAVFDAFIEMLRKRIGEPR